MITTTIETAGFDALIAGTAQAAELGIAEANLAIAEHMRQMVHVLSGETRASIAVAAGTADLSIAANASGEVTAGGAAVFLELGWHTRSGRAVGPFPFMRPAFDLVWPSVPERIGAYLALLGRGQPLPGLASLPAAGPLGP